MSYTIGYIDFQTRSLKASENLYEDITLAAYDLNFTVSDLVLKKYDILLRNSFLFVCKNELKDSFNNVKISKDSSIVTEKKGLELDIYLLTEKKGYIYNGQEKVHIYKFYIQKHVAGSLNKEPFEASSKIPFEQGEIVHIEECKKQKTVSFNTAGDLGSVGETFSQTENSKEISFTQEDLVVLENWLDKNDSFVKELAEKVKKYKIE